MSCFLIRRRKAFMALCNFTSPDCASIIAEYREQFERVDAWQRKIVPNFDDTITIFLDIAPHQRIITRSRRHAEKNLENYLIQENDGQFATSSFAFPWCGQPWLCGSQTLVFWYVVSDVYRGQQFLTMTQDTITHESDSAAVHWCAKEHQNELWVSTRKELLKTIEAYCGENCLETTMLIDQNCAWW